jgi:hypothetical protein
MLRLGAPFSQAREMDLDDIYYARVRLLVIMAKAFLQGCLLGDHRRQAILENAKHVETDSIELGNIIHSHLDQAVEESQGNEDHIFFQRVKLLAVMMKAVAKGFPLGDNRKKAMLENLDGICQFMAYDGQEEIPFLRVA